MLAIGAQTGSVYPYKVGRDGLVYVKFGPMQGSQPLTHIDWSQDGESLQTISVDHELIFCECMLDVGWNVLVISPAMQNAWSAA